MKNNLSPDFLAKLIHVQCVAEMLDVSTRHVYRLADSGRMPRPIRLGGAVRWRRKEIADWVEAGCPEVKKGEGQQ